MDDKQDRIDLLRGRIIRCKSEMDNADAMITNCCNWLIGARDDKKGSHRLTREAVDDLMTKARAALDLFGKAAMQYADDAAEMARLTAD